MHTWSLGSSLEGRSILLLLCALSASAPSHLAAAAKAFCCALDPVYLAAAAAANAAAPGQEQPQCPPQPWMAVMDADVPEFLRSNEPDFREADCAPTQACGTPPGLSPPADLVRCLNAPPGSAPPLPGAAADAEPRLIRALASWRSSKPDSNVPFTVITQLSIERLQQLWAQCGSWKGPLSAAVYMGVQTDATAAEDRATMQRCAIEQVGAVFARTEGAAGCNLDVTLLLEEHATSLAFSRYPINALRNIARLQARTEMMALLDADMMVSPHFASPLPELQQPVLDHCRKKGVVVLPAFDVLGKDKAVAAGVADVLVAGTKAALLDAIKGGQAMAFDSHRFPLGHAATNLTKWKSTDQYYEIPYASRYEPYLVLSRRDAPWHDARFRGYGQNKIVHIAHLHALGYKFLVHPLAFIVHRRHDMSPSRVQFGRDMDKYVRAAAAGAGGGQTQEFTGFVRVNEQFKAAKAAMLAGTFVPFVDVSTTVCRGRLSWWAPASGARAA